MSGNAIVAQSLLTNLDGGAVDAVDFLLHSETLLYSSYANFFLVFHVNSGIFKIDGKEYVSLAGHFSTKSCEKVWKLSLPQVVQVTKVPRLAAWPKIWKASKPTGDSIGLYFFPHEMRCFYLSFHFHFLHCHFHVNNCLIIILYLLLGMMKN